tara:strand:+ start:762 stop:1130 length:369 start_codon:yes stop_codon:yes gene_type:complete
MTETRRSDENFLTATTDTNRAARAIRSAEFLGRGDLPDLNDSGIDLTPSQLKEPLAALCDSGSQLNWQGQATSDQEQSGEEDYEAQDKSNIGYIREEFNFPNQDTYATRTQQEDLALAGLGL